LVEIPAQLQAKAFVVSTIAAEVPSSTAANKTTRRSVSLVIW